MLAKTFHKGEGENLILPPAEGGQPPYRYTLHPQPPTGLTFDPEQRILAGTPVDTLTRSEYTYVAVDQHGRKGKAHFTLAVLPRQTTLLELHGNYPNPFFESTRLELSLGRDAEVHMEIFDLLGRRVRNQHMPSIPAGPLKLPVHGLPTAGVYLYRVTASAEQQSQVRIGRMVQIK